MSHKPAWERRYSRKLVWSDTAIVCATVFFAQLVTTGARPELDATATFREAPTVFSLFLVVTWLLALALCDARNPTVFGTGPEEYKRVINATILAFGVTAIVVILAAPSGAHRDALFVALPCGLVAMIFQRWAWRKRLHQQRKRRKNTYRTLIVGESAHAAHTVRQLKQNSVAGFDLIGAVTDAAGTELLPGLPIVANYDNLLDAVDTHEIDTLIVASSDALTPRRVRRIGWELEDRNVDLILAAALTDIAGPRIHVRPVSGLPLIHVEYPQFTGWRYYAKRASDFALTLLLLVPASVIMLTLAVLIRRDSAGPVIFRQRRLGLDGAPFTMYKLRSMVVDAEDELPGLLDQSDSDGALFKIKGDPRITRIGQFMRRHSLDELPQLFNVLRGEMALVGPRPPLPREVEQYAQWEDRRLLVRPGMSGLWQVSGRSNLTWEESVRLDLFYVENWSMTGDLLILWRTIRTVLHPNGAY